MHQEGDDFQMRDRSPIYSCMRHEARMVACTQGVEDVIDALCTS
jgi:hypothetical protein